MIANPDAGGGKMPALKFKKKALTGDVTISLTNVSAKDANFFGTLARIFADPIYEQLCQGIREGLYSIEYDEADGTARIVIGEAETEE